MTRKELGLGFPDFDESAFRKVEIHEKRNPQFGITFFRSCNTSE